MIPAPAAYTVGPGHAARIDAADQLRRELSRALDRIDELEQMLGLRLASAAGDGLRPAQRMILGMLLSARGVLTIRTLESALYGGRPFADWPSRPHRCIYVHVNHLRKALAAHGLSIATVPAADGTRGYVMAAADVARGRAIYRPGGKS